jgi:hypothetical protein
MKQNNNVEIMNEGISKNQTIKIKRMGLSLDKSDNIWGMYQKDGTKRRKIFNWCLNGKITCWIRTFAYTHIMETKDGVNTTCEKALKKKKWKPRLIIYEHETAIHTVRPWERTYWNA